MLQVNHSEEAIPLKSKLDYKEQLLQLELTQNSLVLQLDRKLSA